MQKLACLVVSSAVAAAADQKFTIDSTSRTFRDEQGRARIFHGFNAVIKKPDYLPIQDHFDFDMSITDEDLQYMQNWGTKIVRLGVMWESVETSPGVYDTAYLDKMDALINKFGDYGIAVIVDNHQDLFSRKLCGEGVPHFYTPEDVDHKCPWGIVGTFFRLAGRCVPLDSYGMQTDDQGLPLLTECQQHSFEDMYTAPEVASAFDALYQNKDGLLDKMFAFWTEVSDRFKSNPNVIGYDILNEPWPANMYKDASLFFKPRKFDSEVLYPVAQRAHDVIRAVDDEKAIFFEGAQFPDTQPFLGGKTLSLGFPETPGGAEYVNRQVLNDHTYCYQAAGKMCDEGEPPLEKSKECRRFHKQKVLKRAEDATNYGVPLMFTEFGACFDGERCATEIRNSADAFDLGLASWAYWQYKSFGDFTTTGGTAEGMFNADGTPQDAKLRSIARTYAHAFQGTPKEMFFQTENASFKTSFTLDSNIAGLTEVYLNRDLFYQSGANMAVSSAAGDALSFTASPVGDNYLAVSIDDAAALDGQEVRVVLTPVLEGTAKGSQDASGYTLDWQVVNQSESSAAAMCTFDIAFGSDAEENFDRHKVYVELVQSNGKVSTVKNDQTVTDACYNMTGGFVRLMKKSLLRDDKLIEIALPYVNAADVSIKVTKDPTSMTSSSVFAQGIDTLSSFIDFLV